MGIGIAQTALLNGHPVHLVDTDPAALERARQHIGQAVAGVASKRGLAGDQLNGAVNNVLSRLTTAADPAAAIEGAALAIEAVAEDLTAKQDVFRALAAASPNAILATNTSALSVAAIASVAENPGRVVGLHFFNPVPAMALVEVVAAATTDPAAAANVARVVTGWGKTPVRSADSPGFIVNRINRPFTIEALRMIDEKLTTATRIDSAMKTIGFPMGPFELMDLIGLDINLASTRAIYEGFGNAPRFLPSPTLERLVAEGTLGRKTGSGFYNYDAAGQEDRISWPACPAATSPTSAWAASPSGSSTASSTRPTGRSATGWPARPTSIPRSSSGRGIRSAPSSEPPASVGRRRWRPRSTASARRTDRPSSRRRSFSRPSASIDRQGAAGRSAA